MNLPELIAHQKQWEHERGIVNANDSLDRTQMELDEAKEETDPYRRLVEMCDVLIILSGGMAKLLDDLNLPAEVINTIIQMKLDINDQKYPEEQFSAHSVSTAITMSRHYWKVDPLEWDVDGDIY